MKKLLSSEDGWSILLGFGILALGCLLVFTSPQKGLFNTHQRFSDLMKVENDRAPFKTLAWHQHYLKKNDLRFSNSPKGKAIKDFTSTPRNWTSNPLEAFILTEEKAIEYARNGQEAYIETINKEADSYAFAIATEDSARSLNFQDSLINKRASMAINAWVNHRGALKRLEKKQSGKGRNNLWEWLAIGVFLLIVFWPAVKKMNSSGKGYVKSFVALFLLATLAFLFAGQRDIKHMGIGYAFWAIALGLIIGNSVGTPSWLKKALHSELYIKTALILLGAEILLSKLMAIGLPGVFIAWMVTPIVLIATYWFGQRILKITSKSLNITIAADLSVCGVSAAVAVGAASGAKKEELTLAIGLSMLFTTIMMVVQPLFVEAFSIDPIVGGAWIGGTIDATGAVAAAGSSSYLGDEGLMAATTIKLIQNVLIGIIAFVVAVVFAKNSSNPKTSKKAQIWQSTPKFIFGFLGASLLFSLIYAILGNDMGHTLIDHGLIRGFSKNIRTWIFALAFVSIGLNINFKELRASIKGGKPLFLYLAGQLFNLILTFLAAWLMFNVFFPETSLD